MTESSRWLSVFCDTTGQIEEILHPGRVARNFLCRIWHPCRGPLPGCNFLCTATGGVAKNAQPPATLCNPSGIQCGYTRTNYAQIVRPHLISAVSIRMFYTFPIMHL